RGIKGKKGVLWWEIVRIVRAKRPPYLLLENVDRLLKSPALQRGRDFGVLLASLANLGYAVEWRVVNAADYAQPQRRRRVFIFAAQAGTPAAAVMKETGSRPSYLTKAGFFARTFPVREETATLDLPCGPDACLDRRLTRVSDHFAFEFRNAGVMVDRALWTHKVLPKGETVATMESKLDVEVEEPFFVPDNLLPRWRKMKGAKREERTARNGHVYEYAEGAIAFPDHIDQPARTLLTSEGGTSPSRIKHIIKHPGTERLRVLTPQECERLNGFPDGWTAGLPDHWRYFTMGNALVVGLIERMAHQLPTALPATVKANERAITVSPHTV
ncbi:MAG: (cytosine-5)-methyltransferase 1, partial [Thermoplasmata archaeon]|nr:(cytosine-5)-methyltransferase 1 [Thermoplasmata archaeon]